MERNVWSVLAALGVLATTAAGGPWRQIGGPEAAPRTGAVVLRAPGGPILTFGGEPGKAGYVRRFDGENNRWSDLAPARPPARRGIHPTYAAAMDPAGNRIYCLSMGTLYVYDLGGQRWAETLAETTPRGVVAWARAADSDRFGLWLFDRDAGWKDLDCKGDLYRPYCDSEGMTYDAERDRMLLGWGGGYQKRGDGRLTAFDFRTRELTVLRPAAAEIGHIRNTREMQYVDHADWVVFAEPYLLGKGEDATKLLRIYDCAADRYALLDAGTPPGMKAHSMGISYDASRKALYVLTVRGAPWALRLDPATAKLRGVPPAPPEPSAAEKARATLADPAYVP